MDEASPFLKVPLWLLLLREPSIRKQTRHYGLCVSHSTALTDVNAVMLSGDRVSKPGPVADAFFFLWVYLRRALHPG